MMLASLGKMPTTSARRLTSLLRRSSGLMLSREGQVGQHVVLAVVHQRGELGPTPAQLVGDMAPGLMRSVSIGLQEGLADRGSDHGVLALRNMRQGISDPMNATPLPAGAEHAGDGVAQPVMGIRDHQLDALEATLDHPFEKDRPERFGLRRPDAETDDLAAA